MNNENDENFDKKLNDYGNCYYYYYYYYNYYYY